MSKILSLFGLKKEDEENIPEMILHKNDPEPYYDKELKTWMIPGQEEEIKKALLEQKRPPPIGKSKKSETNIDKEVHNNNELVNPRNQRFNNKSQIKNSKNRYASVIQNINATKEDFHKKEIKEENPQKSEEEKIENNNSISNPSNIKENELLYQPITPKTTVINTYLKKRKNKKNIIFRINNQKK